MSKLLEIANQRRKLAEGVNRYSPTNPYTASHPDALSTGDDRGRGYHNGQVGTLTEQRKLQEWQRLNTYTPQRPYTIKDTE